VCAKSRGGEQLAYISRWMYASIHLFVCMCVHLFVCVYVCTSVCVYICVYICLCGWVGTYACMCSSVYVCAHVCVSLCVCRDGGGGVGRVAFARGKLCTQ